MPSYSNAPNLFPRHLMQNAGSISFNAASIISFSATLLYAARIYLYRWSLHFDTP